MSSWYLLLSFLYRVRGAIHGDAYLVDPEGKGLDRDRQ